MKVMKIGGFMIKSVQYICEYFKFKFLFVCILLFVIFFNMKKVYATTSGQLDITKYDDVWFTRRGGGKDYQSDKLGFYSLNGDVVYCIEPEAHITTDSYVGEFGFINSPYSREINDYISLVAYYGYEYPGHQTLRYRMATQALIWEKTGGQIIEFWTQASGWGDNINVDYEKGQILELINRHYLKPSFDNTSVKGYVNKEIVLTDSNNVLSEYEVSDDGGNIVRIDGNSIYITPVSGGGNVVLSKKVYQEGDTIIYFGSDGLSQKMARLRLESEVNSVINLDVLSAKVKVVKVDYDTNQVVKRSNISFKIYDKVRGTYVCENPECTFTTNQDGYFLTSFLESGTYVLEEVDSYIDGYLWNDQVVEFSVDENSNIVDGVLTVYFSNKAVYGRVNVKKFGEELIKEKDGYTYTNIELPNVKLGLYAFSDIYDSLGNLVYSKDDLVCVLVTDSLGEAYVDNLYLGSYYIKEIETDSSHVLDLEIYYFDLFYIDQYTEKVEYSLTLVNHIPKGELDFKKTDFVESKGLPDTLIEIYDLEDNLVFSGRTDVNGDIVIKELPVGKYYILEKEAPLGYLLNNEKLFFEIKENGEVVKCVMKDELEVLVPDTLSYAFPFKEIVPLFMFCVGLGVFFYEEKFS